MRVSAAAVVCSISLGIIGCAGSTSSAPDEQSGVSEDELRKLGANGALGCKATSGKERFGLVAASAGKFALLGLKPAADLYALSGSTGTLTTTTSTWTWKNNSSSLKLDTRSMKGTLERGSRSTNVTCESAPAAEAASWRTANALVGYASEIDGLADAVLESSEHSHRPKEFTVFAIETDRRSTLSLGQTERGTAGALPGDDDAQSLADENDFSYGAISAAYALGGGDDYGEWFQGASDGISLSGSVVPALPAGTRAGFIARTKVTALKTLVDSAQPSAVEITVGPLTFFVPDSFPR